MLREVRSLQPLLDFFATSGYEERAGDPSVCDVCFDNPHDAPVPAIGEA